MFKGKWKNCGIKTPDDIHTTYNMKNKKKMYWLLYTHPCMNTLAHAYIHMYKLKAKENIAHTRNYVCVLLQKKERIWYLSPPHSIPLFQ